jgi:lipopolysaccharide export system permease protein
MLKVTTRYICAQFIPAFLAGFIFFVAFLNTFYMFRLLGMIVNKGLDFLTVLQMIFNLSISFFPLAAPLAFFFSTIYVLNRLSEDSEIIAMRSFGMTRFKIYFPFLLISLVFSIGLNSLYSVLIPKANADFKNTIVRLSSNGMLSSIKSGQFFTDIPNATLFAQHVSEDGNSFEKVFLHLKDKSSDEQRIILANSGSLIKIYSNEWRAPSLRLHLNEGNIIHINKTEDRMEKVLFKEYDFPIFNSEYISQNLDKDSMKTNTELKKLLNEKYIKWQNGILDKTVSSNEKFELRKSYYKTGNEYYSRYVTFTQIMLFVLVGFSLGIKKGRGNSRGNSVIAIAVLLGYYTIYFLMISFSQKGLIDPRITNFGPSLMLLIVGIHFYRKLDWAT